MTTMKCHLAGPPLYTLRPPLPLRLISSTSSVLICSSCPAHQLRGWQVTPQSFFVTLTHFDLLCYSDTWHMCGVVCYLCLTVVMNVYFADLTLESLPGVTWKTGVSGSLDLPPPASQHLVADPAWCGQPVCRLQEHVSTPHTLGRALHPPDGRHPGRGVACSPLLSCLHLPTLVTQGSPEVGPSLVSVQ